MEYEYIDGKPCIVLGPKLFFVFCMRRERGIQTFYYPAYQTTPIYFSLKDLPLIGSILSP